MIVRMNVDGHKDLHSTLQPPLKLRHHEMIGALGLLQEIRGENFKPEENIILLAEQLERGSDRSKKVATNLYLQAGFIAIHKA